MTYDVAIIGGGINGAGCARELAMRGLKVVLLEKGEFGQGTSGRSSKLIHGGLRYLEQFHFGLVFEASRERKLLLENAPRLVKPLPFLLPIYRGGPHPVWKIRLGMWLYDALALFQNVKPHRWLDAGEILKLEPGLASDGLLGGVLYYDAQMDDRRLCIETINQAKRFGADAYDHTRVKKVIRSGDTVDYLDTDKGQIFANVYVNTTGPWCDELLESKTPLLRLSKGSHLVVQKLADHAILATAKSDGRVFFIMPWKNQTLIGTTEIDYQGSPDDAVISEEERNYLLSETHRILPGVDLNVVDSFAGVRPLINQTESLGSVSREEAIIVHAANFVSLIGGKYTTFRSVTERLARQVWRMLKRPEPFKSLTKHLNYE